MDVGWNSSGKSILSNPRNSQSLLVAVSKGLQAVEGSAPPPCPLLMKCAELNLDVTFLHNMSLGFLADTNVEIGLLMWPAPRHGALGGDMGLREESESESESDSIY